METASHVRQWLEKEAESEGYRPALRRVVGLKSLDSHLGYNVKQMYSVCKLSCDGENRYSPCWGKKKEEGKENNKDAVFVFSCLRMF